jgi:hypothetical protein
MVIDLTAAVVAVAAFVVRVARSLQLSDWGYAAAEWLTDYEAGFVRRGLGGQLISWIPLLDDQQGLLVIVTALFVAVVALQAVVVGLVVRRLGNAWPLLVWLIPAGPLLATVQTAWQPFPGFANQFVFRKEYLGYLILLGVAVLFLRRPDVVQRHQLPVAVVAGALFAVAALVHEALVLPAAAAAAMLMLFMVVSPRRRRVVAALVTFVPPTLVAMAFAAAGPLAPGSAGIIAAGLDPSIQQWLGGRDAIRASSPYFWLEQSGTNGIAFAKGAVIDSGAWRIWLVLAVLIAALVVVASWLADSRRSTTRPRVIAGAVIVAVTAPLFVLGSDTGRWLSALAVLTLNTVLVISAGRSSDGRSVASRSRWPIAAVVVLIALTLAAGLPETGDPTGLLLGRR